MASSGRRRRSKAAAIVAKPPGLRRFRHNFRWNGVALVPYKLRTHRGGDFAGASRQVIAGDRSEPIAFELRYFEIEPGGFTSFERHRHCHVVIGMRGRGRVRIGAQEHRVRRFDAVYIAPNLPHQLRADGRTPFGFFCIVDRKRDRPRPVDN